jgi:hypothetical protein
VAVGGQCTFAGSPGVTVVPDRGGQREDPLQNTDHHRTGSAARVALWAELAFEGLVDRFDHLPQRFERRGFGALGVAAELVPIAARVGPVFAEEQFQAAGGPGPGEPGAGRLGTRHRRHRWAT